MSLQVYRTEDGRQKLSLRCNSQYIPLLNVEISIFILFGKLWILACVEAYRFAKLTDFKSVFGSLVGCLDPESCLDPDSSNVLGSFQTLSARLNSIFLSVSYELYLFGENKASIVQYF